MQYLKLYLLLINAAGFVLMLADKHLARKRAIRIPEATLMGMAILGGSLGVLLGMYTARHKTRKPRFFIGVPVIFVLQIIVGVLIYFQ